MKEQLGEQVRLCTFNYSGKEVFNFGIDDLKLNTQIFEKDKPVKFEATLKIILKERKTILWFLYLLMEKDLLNKV